MKLHKYLQIYHVKKQKQIYNDKKVLNFYLTNSL